MSDDNTVRWIVDIDERSGRPTATFSGEKLFVSFDERQRQSRVWQPFDIPDYIVMSNWITSDQFVIEIESYLADFTGPEQDS